MSSPDRQNIGPALSILTALERAPLAPAALAAATGLPPFTLGAECARLKTSGAIRLSVARWELTEAGWEALYEDRQLHLI